MARKVSDFCRRRARIAWPVVIGQATEDFPHRDGLRSDQDDIEHWTLKLGTKRARYGIIFILKRRFSLKNPRFCRGVKHYTTTTPLPDSTPFQNFAAVFADSVERKKSPPRLTQR